MRLLCLIGKHQWQGYECAACGTPRDERDFQRHDSATGMDKLYDYTIEVEHQPSGAFLAKCSALSFPVEASTEKRAIHLTVRHLRELVRLYTGKRWLFSIRPAIRKTSLPGLYHVQIAVRLSDRDYF